MATSGKLSEGSNQTLGLSVDASPHGMWVISTIDEALGALAAIEDGRLPVSDAAYASLSIEGLLSGLRIELQGDAYRGTVPGNLARGLWLLQREVYKAVAHTLYGTDNYAKIPRQDLHLYTLVFKVDEGSSKLWAKATRLVGSLVEKAMEGMEPAQKAKLIIRLSLVIASAVGLYLAVVFGLPAVLDHLDKADSRNAMLEQQAVAKAADESRDAHQLEMERLRLEQQSLQNELISDLLGRVATAVAADPVSARLDTAITEGAKAVVKHSSDATSIVVGEAYLSAQNIADLNQRAARLPPQEFLLTGHFYVTEASTPSTDGVARVGLSGFGEEFLADINLTPGQTKLTSHQSDQLYLAVKRKARMYLTVRVQRYSDGSIKHAEIEGLPQDPVSADASAPRSQPLAPSPSTAQRKAWDPSQQITLDLDFDAPQ